MINKHTEPAKLITYNKDGLIEREHFGYVVRCNRERVIEKLGDDKNYPFYMRSCAKPLQASLLIDYELDKKYNLTEEEIAVCTASHAGEKIHIETVQRILDKFEISQTKLKCGNKLPMSKSAQKELLLHGDEATSIHNNSSGKHAMMLGLCKLNDWDMDNYDSINHPLQKEIKRKLYELCELHSEYPVTKDECGIPVHSMPLEHMIKGYLNLFCNPKYKKIKNAFLKFPYIIGGENRTDTKVMENSTLIAKVGAGGLCAVINTELEEGFIVKISDTDITAREIVTIDLINNLHWADIEVSHELTTHYGEKIGEITTHL